MEEEAHIDFGGSTISANFTRQQDVDEVVNDATVVWKFIQENKNASDLREQVMEHYRDFSSKFPIIVQLMINNNVFSKKALRDYIIKHGSSTINSMEDFLNIQSYYIMYVDMENPKFKGRSMRFFNDRREEYRKLVADSDKDFRAKAKRIEARFEDEQEELLQEDIKDLITQLKLAKEQSPTSS